MSEFFFRKAKVFSEKWEDYFEMRLAQGVPSIEETLDLLLLKENLTEEEKVMLEEYHEVKKVMTDLVEFMKLNKVRVFEHQRQLHIPEFVKNNETLLRVWIEKWEYLIKNSFDISEVERGMCRRRV